MDNIISIFSNKSVLIISGLFLILFLYKRYILQNIIQLINFVKKLWLLLKERPFISLCLLLLFVNVFFPKWPPRPDNIIDVKNTSIIIIDSLNKFNKDVVAHNAILIKTLQERMAIDANDLSSMANVRTQFRLFYTAILAGLSSLLFRKDTTRKDIIRITLLFLIVIMYLLEIHFGDLNRRQKDVYWTKVVAANSLINLKPNDSTWYKLDDSTVAFKWDSVSKRDATIPRKLKAALLLDLEQVVYYFIPWSVLFFIPPNSLTNKKEYGRKYGSPRFKRS